MDSLQSQLQNVAGAITSIQSYFVTGQFQSLPATSCFTIALFNSSLPSGYYWVRASNGSAVRVYCDMTRSMWWTHWRVAYLQFENGSDPCPEGFIERNNFDLRTCAIDSVSGGCHPVLFDTHDITYSRVYWPTNIIHLMLLRILDVA